MDNKILIKNDNGKEIEYDILFTFESNDEKKQYVVYTKYEKDKDGNIITYSSYYYNDDGERKLYNVDSADEIKYIDEVINSIEYDIKNNNE